MEEQVDTTSIQNPEAEPTKQPFKVFETEEDYNKAFKSEVSKAKYSWLQEVGASSVEDFKQKEAVYKKSIDESEAMRTELENVKKEAQKAKEQNLILKFHIDSEFAEDALTLAKSKVSDKVDLKTALEDVIKRNPSWLESVGDNKIQIGVDKKEYSKPEISNLSKKYPWIK